MTDWDSIGKSYGVLPPGGGTPLQIFGNPFQLMAEGRHTNGSFALIVASFAPSTGARGHLHRGHDEAFYVLDGTFRFRAGTEEIVGEAGSLCLAPRGAAHGFTNIGETDGRLLGVIAPSGYEKHFLEIGALKPAEATPQVLAEIFAKYDQEPA